MLGRGLKRDNANWTNGLEARAQPLTYFGQIVHELIIGTAKTELVED